MTTTTWGITRRVRVADRRMAGSVVHGSVLAALVGGVAALWMILSLVAALLAAPVATMTTLERDGAWGVPGVMRQGSSEIMSLVRASVTGESR